MNYSTRCIPVLAVIALFGCKQTRTAESTSTSTPPATTPAPYATPAPAPNGAVPPALDKAESLAEDVQDDIAASAWPAAETKARALMSAKDQLASSGIPAAAVATFGALTDSLLSAVAKKDTNPARGIANRISRAINGMMAAFSTKVPIDVAYMDVAARDALYAADEKRWPAAETAVAELRRRYATVQEHVKERAAALDKTISSELDRMEKAATEKKQKALTSLAKTLLEDIDRIEKTY